MDSFVEKILVLVVISISISSSWSFRLEAEAKVIEQRLTHSIHPNLTECPSYKQVCDYLQELAGANPRVDLFEDYKTDGLRTIYFVTIKPYLQTNVKNPKPEPERRSYWLEGGLDASSCYPIRILIAIVDMLANDCPPQFRHNNYYLVPLANPDGHEEARTANPTWLKNMEHNWDVPSPCEGTRINRNFPVKSDCDGSCFCSDPCSDDYCGKTAASTNEVQHLIALRNSVPDLTLSFSFFEFVRQLILYPMAEKNEPQDASHKPLSTLAKNYIESSGGPITTTGPYYDYFRHSGTSMDYWHHSQPSCLSYSFFIKTVDETVLDVYPAAKQILNAIFVMIEPTAAG